MHCPLTFTESYQRQRFHGYLFMLDVCCEVSRVQPGGITLLAPGNTRDGVGVCIVYSLCNATQNIH